MSSVLKKLRTRSRTRTKRPRSFSSRLKHKIKLPVVHATKLSIGTFHKANHFSGQEKRLEGDKRVAEFRRWCGQVGLELHPSLYIGEHGSCHKIGVVAMDDIAQGECLALIPRSAILSCANSTVDEIVKDDKQLENVTSSWIPLLIALAAEYSLKTKSYWHPYLTLVPNNEGCGPPMLWSASERERLLEGTGVCKLVEDDLERIEEDFTNVALPFMQRNPQIFRSEVRTYQVYKKLVSLVMSYSFTDAEDARLNSSTMMVPFVDLLNHSSNHHAELTFHNKTLKLMAARNIRKGEEVMNTYGTLPNMSLLHTYGFCEVSNPHDIALITADWIHHVYLACSSQEDTLSTARRQKHWEQIKSDDLLEDDYCVDREGDPDLELLFLIKLLHSKKNKYESLVSKQKLEDMSVQSLNDEEATFLKRLARYRLSLFPESYDSLVPLARNTVGIKMTEKERYALYLSMGQQQCLSTLLMQMDGTCEL